MTDRPTIICHMTMSIDGKVTGDFLTNSNSATAIDEYYNIHRGSGADAFACGRVTMEESFTGGWQPDWSAYQQASVLHMDFCADETARYFAVAFDRHGNLGWKTSHIRDEDPGYDNAHIVEVLCEDTPVSHLAYYQRIGVSYLFAGEHELNLPLALEKLNHYYGIQNLLLEGGSEINGAFQREGVIDELSLVVAPVIAGANAKPLFADADLEEYMLMESKVFTQSGAQWLRYRSKRA